jgi:hypothetical protein
MKKRYHYFFLSLSKESAGMLITGSAFAMLDSKVQTHHAKPRHKQEDEPRKEIDQTNKQTQGNATMMNQQKKKKELLESVLCSSS